MTLLVLFPALCGGEQSVSLQKGIQQVIEGVDSKAQVGIVALSLRGEGSYHHNGDKRYVPGSVLKLFIAAAALDVMGVDYRFETRIVTDGVVKQGALAGNCYLIASGDPSLDFTGLAKLIRGLKAQGIRRIKGDFLIDVSVFDDVVQGPGWMWDEKPSFWCSPLGALNVEHNCLAFEIGPGSVVGCPCRVSVYPYFDSLELINHSTTGNRCHTVEVRRLSDHQFEVVGSMGLFEEKVRRLLPMRTPLSFSETLVKTLLRQHQIWIEGKIRVGKSPRCGVVLTSHLSKPLSELLKPLLKESDNLYADALFKKIGAIRYCRQGTWQTGKDAVYEFLEKKVGLDTSMMVIVDGSGTSRYNLLSPEQVGLFLKWVHRDCAGGKWIKGALALGGVDGTLKNRMKTADLKAQVIGKTGTMTGVSSICGFLGEEIAFVIFVNGHVKSGREIKKHLEDEVCRVLMSSTFARSRGSK